MRAFLENRPKDNQSGVWQMSYYGLNYMAHWHREIELLYVKNGEYNLTINNESITAYAGDLVIVKSGEIHQGTSNKDTLATVLLLNTEVLGGVYKICETLPTLISSKEISENKLKKMIISTISDVRNELLNKGDFYEYIIKSSLTKMFISLGRIFKTENNDSKNYGIDKLLEFQALLDYISANYNKNITLESASEFVHFSPFYFSKMFKKITNVTFVSYINSVKTQKAAELLIETEMNISQISSKCGFNNIRNFNRVFLSNYGYTPSKYRKLGLQKNKLNAVRQNELHLALTSCEREFF